MDNSTIIFILLYSITVVALLLTMITISLTLRVKTLETIIDKIVKGEFDDDSNSY